MGEMVWELPQTSGRQVMKYIETLRDLEKQLRDIDEKIRDLEYRRRNLIELRNRVLSYLRDEEDPWHYVGGFYVGFYIGFYLQLKPLMLLSSW